MRNHGDIEAVSTRNNNRCPLTTTFAYLRNFAGLVTDIILTPEDLFFSTKSGKELAIAQKSSLWPFCLQSHQVLEITF